VWLALIVVAAVIPACSSYPSTPRPVSASAVVAQPSPASTLRFRRIVDSVGAGKVSVVNGKTVDPKDWPALTQATFSKTQPDGTVEAFSCTASLVGPAVLLTAAHCVDARKPNGQTLAASLELPHKTIKMTCTMSSPYIHAPIPSVETPRDSADFALCLLTPALDAIPEYASLEYETLDFQNALSTSAPVLITGYGCTSISLVGDKFKFGTLDDTLRVGDETISGIPQAIGVDKDYLTTTSVAAAEPALCPGDSGGPLMSGASVAHQAVPRRIVGLNSSIQADTSGSTLDLVSRYAALRTSDFAAFLDSWLAANGAPIVCGANWAPGNWPCRM
jgi:hypothetical protein